MSTKKRKQDRDSPISAGWVQKVVREGQGDKGYRGSRNKYPAARRLKCSNCRRTWAFRETLLHAVCTACKEGRLS